MKPLDKWVRLPILVVLTIVPVLYIALVVLIVSGLSDSKQFLRDIGIIK